MFQGCGAVVQARHIGLVKVGDQVVVNQCPSGSDSGSVKVRSSQKLKGVAVSIPAVHIFLMLLGSAPTDARVEQCTL
jgi:hypothetical protein